MVDTNGQKKKQSKDFIFAVGRRKASVARVRLYDKIKDGLTWGELAVNKGDFVVNGKPASEYFPGETMRYSYTEPLRITNAQNKFTITARVEGGGKAGQVQALVHGIARALSAFDAESYRGPLKKRGLLTRDARVRQRRMVGTGGKARRKKQSPKR